MFHYQSIFGRVISQALVLIAIAILALPLFLILKESVKGQGISNYWVVIQRTPFAAFFMNSVIVSVATVAIVIVLSLLAAYGLTVLRPRGSKIMSVLILAGLSLPAIALIVPLFSVIQTLGLLNTYWAVIVPLAVLGIPFGVLLASNYMAALPVEMYEASRLDGANSWQFLVHILLPMCRPILSVIAIFTFLAAWNEYLIPLVFVQNTDLQVLTQVPSYFQNERIGDTPKIFAANVLISLPIVAVYVLLQRSFRNGLVAGAIK